MTFSTKLTNKEIRSLRSIGHQLKPVVIISQHLNDNIYREIERALDDHELIKIKLNLPEREERAELATELAATHEAQLVQLIGKIGLYYRLARKQNQKLSNLVRYRNLLEG